MEIMIDWKEGQYPSFNLGLASKEGQDPFIVIRGCKIMNGSKGEFVSYPSKKNEQTGKYWNHVQGNERFNAAVLEKAKAAQPVARQDIDESIPF